jgi:hypothetical protein
MCAAHARPWPMAAMRYALCAMRSGPRTYDLRIIGDDSRFFALLGYLRRKS